MGKRDLVFACVVVATGSALATYFRYSHSSSSADQEPASRWSANAFPAAVDGVNAAIRKGWAETSTTPAPAASDLAVMRRLSLALTGSIPSLEEIRKFEASPRASRIDAHLNVLLKDRRAADYLAERMARAFVGTEDGPFIVFRRRRFVSWLSDQFFANRRYDAIVRDLIAGDGFWTDHPATNFVTVTREEKSERPDPERLAARVSRAFLGSRIDCAQCHDHPFQSWKQEDFRGLAAFFGGVHADLRGVTDDALDYQPLDRKTKEAKAVAPRVPSLPELCPTEGDARDRLASWVTNPKNPRLAIATTNRVWALLFGRPLVDPVDDLPAESDLPPTLILLADDFAAHGYDLHRLICLIASTEAFRLESARDASNGSPTDQDEEAWAVFPLSRMRPEQVAGSLYQATSVSTLGPQFHWFFRLIAYTQRNDFVRRYGDTGEDEFGSRSGTIPQRLLLMNGDLVVERIKEDLFSATSQVASLSSDAKSAVEAVYLSVLTRRPTPEERDYFVAKIEATEKDERIARVTDLYWTLLNATEFSWNH